MYEALASLIKGELCGDRAQFVTGALTDFYRSPGSSGYHAATNHVAELLRDIAVDDLAIERYPIDGETTRLGRTMPPAWEPVSARLTVIAPVQERVTGYPDVPSCLPWWSGATSPGGVEVELVDVGAGLSEADYGGRDVAGKAVLIRDSETRPAWHHAAELARRKGVVGIVTDFLHSQTPPWRTRTSVPHAVQLLRLPARWDNPWAFAVGYTAAERLARLAAAGPVRLRARVEVKSFKGEGQNLIATIAGRERPEEAVFFISHTSAGTKPCANCAAGPALMVEVARTMASLIGSGKLPRPRRSVKFLFVAEGLGSANYLAVHREELPGTRLAICYDSVGHRQSSLKSALMFYRSPDSNPTYVNDLGAALIDRLPKEADWPFRQGKAISLVNFQVMPYTPWSDNHYWAACGVPAPLIMSWPDLYFHTQLLTAEHTDPMVFERVGLVTGVLALAVANAGAREACVIMQEVAARAVLRLARVVRDGAAAVNDGANTADAASRGLRRLAYLARRDAEAVRSTLSLVDETEAGAEAARRLAEELCRDLEARREVESRRLGALLGVTSAPEQAPADPAASVVPVRTVDAFPPGVAGLDYETMAGLVRRLNADDPAANWETLRILADELWSLMDGRRTLGEIAEAVGFEFGLRLAAGSLQVLAQGLERAGMARLESRGE